ncbi:MAG: riboflavin synthase [Chlorobium sp.]
MFTGIIKDVGRVRGVTRRQGGLRLRVQYNNPKEFNHLSVDESVNINGACQTVVALGEGWFEVDTVEETLSKTTLGALHNGSLVNLERAIRPLDRLGGHFVLGHVDCAAPVQEIRELGSSRELWIAFPENFSAMIVSAGSITIDGISLTVAKLDAQLFAVAIIPFTFAQTTINELKPGSRVNLEFDILGKYVARQLARASSSEKKNAQTDTRLNEAWLQENGF